MDSIIFYQAPAPSANPVFPTPGTQIEPAAGFPQQRNLWDNAETQGVSAGQLPLPSLGLGSRLSESSNAPIFTCPVPRPINDTLVSENSDFDGPVLRDCIETIEPSVASRGATFQRDSGELAHSNPTWGATADRPILVKDEIREDSFSSRANCDSLFDSSGLRSTPISLPRIEMNETGASDLPTPSECDESRVSPWVWGPPPQCPTTGGPDWGSRTNMESSHPTAKRADRSRRGRKQLGAAPKRTRQPKTFGLALQKPFPSRPLAKPNVQGRPFPSRTSTLSEHPLEAARTPLVLSSSKLLQNAVAALSGTSKPGRPAKASVSSCSDNAEWEIIRIVDHRSTMGGREYKVAWADTWVGEADLGNAQKTLQQYYLGGAGGQHRKPKAAVRL